jgi:hypothetical protein
MVRPIVVEKSGLVKELFTSVATLRCDMKRCVASPNRRNTLFLTSQSKRRYLFNDRIVGWCRDMRVCRGPL